MEEIGHTGRRNGVIANMLMWKFTLYKQRSSINQSRYSELALTKYA